MTWLSVSVEGFDRLMSRLEAGNLYYEPWRQMLEKATKLVERRAKKRAPIGTGPGGHGSIRLSITSQVVGRPVPMYGKVSFPNLTKPWGAKQFRYPGALEGSRRYHYSAGGPKPGRPTRGWFVGSLTGAKRSIDRMMKQAAEEIERRWRQ